MILERGGARLIVSELHDCAAVYVGGVHGGRTVLVYEPAELLAIAGELTRIAAARLNDREAELDSCAVKRLRSVP